MSISSVTDSTILAQPDNAVGNKELGRSDFMTLFITQLQYQDPMKPMDSYEMASQLAQFSNMEATMKMSGSMDKMLEYQTSQNNLQVLSLLDSEVQVEGNMMGVKSGEVSTNQFAISEQTESVAVEIYDSANRMVWQQDMGSLSADVYELAWDGNNSAGEEVADGAYRYVVKAYGFNGELVDVGYTSTGTVTGIQFKDGAAMLTLDDYIETSVGEILKVK